MSLETLNNLLSDFDPDSPNFPPTIIYNEGWLLRLVVDWFSKSGIPGHPLSYYQMTSGGKLVPTRKSGICPNVHQVHIGCSGEVVPCWYSLLSMPIMGNALHQSFLDVWCSDRYKKYRERMVRDQVMPHCRHCIGIYKKNLFEFRGFAREIHK